VLDGYTNLNIKLRGKMAAIAWGYAYFIMVKVNPTYIMNVEAASSNKPSMPVYQLVTIKH
jgi:hypothetical protein